jgi:hypothetical protein
MWSLIAGTSRTEPSIDDAEAANRIKIATTTKDLVGTIGA